MEMENEQDFLERMSQNLEDSWQEAIRTMTSDQACKFLKEVCDDEGIDLIISMRLHILADWIQQQHHHQLAVQGAIIGAFASGHMEGKEGESYSKAILLQIADLLDLEIPESIKNGSWREQHAGGYLLVPTDPLRP